MSTAATRVVNVKSKEGYDVYIGRRMPRSKAYADGYFGNPFKQGEPGVEDAVEAYRHHFLARIATDPEFKRRVLELRGKRIACWCKPNDCHGDVIAEWLKKHAS